MKRVIGFLLQFAVLVLVLVLLAVFFVFCWRGFLEFLAACVVFAGACYVLRYLQKCWDSVSLGEEVFLWVRRVRLRKNPPDSKP